MKDGGRSYNNVESSRLGAVQANGPTSLRTRHPLWIPAVISCTINEICISSRQSACDEGPFSSSSTRKLSVPCSLKAKDLVIDR